MNKNYSILGCGWLGMPLAKELLQNGYSIKGSTTSAAKLESLKGEGILPFQIQLTEKKAQGKLNDFLKGSTGLIIDIPPGLRQNPSEDFVQKIKNLLPFIEKSKVAHLVFISSTSVFKNEEGNPIYKENDKPNASSQAGMQLRAVEDLLLENTNFKTTIVRFGGLLGGDRHPVKFLAGRSNVSNPQAPINLIKRKDCIALIKNIIENETYLPIVHGVFPYHPKKEFYYTDKAEELNLESPSFNTKKESVGKLVSTEVTTHKLHFTFRHQP